MCYLNNKYQGLNIIIKVKLFFIILYYVKQYTFKEFFDPI